MPDAPAVAGTRDSSFHVGPLPLQQLADGARDLGHGQGRKLRRDLAHQFQSVVVERMRKRSGISGMVVAATGRGSIRARHKVEAPGLQRAMTTPRA